MGHGHGDGGSSQGQTSTAEQQSRGEHILFIGAKRALAGGLLAGAIALAGQLLIGRVYSGTEARHLISALLPSARSVGSVLVTASATILALMLTMLSLGRHITSALEANFFRRIGRIALLCTIALAGGILLMLLLTFPVQQSTHLPTAWFSLIYFALITLVAGLVGLFIGMVLMLLNAIESLIEVVRPSGGSEPSSRANGASSATGSENGQSASGSASSSSEPSSAA